MIFSATCHPSHPPPIYNLPTCSLHVYWTVVRYKSKPLELEMVQIEALAQRATVCNFVFAPTQNRLPRAIEQPLVSSSALHFLGVDMFQVISSP